MIEYVSRCIRRLADLNLFKSNSNDEETITIERNATRIYLVLFLIGSFILVVYTSLATETVQVTVTNPAVSKYNDLYKEYSTTLKCFCSAIAVKYDKFIQVEAEYHQICSSSFIEDQWIIDSYRYQPEIMWPMDIRAVISSHAQLLQIFCRNSKRSIAFSLAELRSSSTISSVALPRSTLDVQLEIQKQNLQSASTWVLSVLVNFYKLMISSNHVMTGLGTNSFFSIASNQSTYASVGINGYQLNSNITPCFCLTVDNCAIPAQFYSTPRFPTYGFYNLDIFRGQTVPMNGIQTGCFALDSGLSSTLQCYYNRSCLDLLVPNSSFYKPLNASITSRYLMNSTIESIYQGLFVERWLFNASYEDYYTKCAPSSCIYSFNRRNNAFIILTTIFASIGGLNTILRFLAPQLVTIFDMIKKRINRRNTRVQVTAAPLTENPTLLVRIKQGSHFIGNNLRGLNLFDSHSNEPITERRERRVTRIYIVSLLTTLIILIFYTAFSEETKTFTIFSPSQIVYDELYRKYSDTIECSCDKIAIEHSKFVSLWVTYHQICSSNFVSSNFITRLSFLRSYMNMHYADFFRLSPTYFQWLATLCVLSQLVFSNQLIAFQSQLFVQPKLLSRIAFQIQANRLIDSFIGAVQIYFSRSMTILRATLSMVQPLSATYSLVYDLPIINSSSGFHVKIEPSNVFTGCSCIANPFTCSMNSQLYHWSSMNDTFYPVFTLNGIRTACSSLESVLQSNLECWYSTGCYDKVLGFWQNRTHSSSGFPEILNANITSRFNPSTVINRLIEQLMIESWSRKILYESYFSECAPQFCTYSITRRRDITFLVATLLGVFSGLNLALRLIIPLIVRMLNQLSIRHQRNRLYFKQIIQRLPSKLAELNIFYKRNESSPMTLPHERRSTRIYILLLSTSLFGLSLFYLLVEQSTLVIKLNPTIDVYKTLQQSSSITSLRCPCAQLSIPYRTFVQANTAIHPVCSSSFIESPWIDSIFDNGNWSASNQTDFQNRGGLYFLGLYKFCELFQENTSNYISQFLSNTVISAEIIPEKELGAQINEAIDKTYAYNRMDYSQMFFFADEISNKNQMLTIYSSNWIISPLPQNTNLIGFPLAMEPVSYGNCSCATSSQCQQPATFRGETMPGFIASCSPLNTIFQSSLICLYNQTCIDRINERRLTIQTLAMPNDPQKYPINRTIGQILRNGLDIEWYVQHNYSLYFHQCGSTSCSYTIKERRSFLLVVTNILGYYGGLSVALRFSVPYLSRLSNII